ncbi:EF-hand domain-containing protein [Pseudomonas juntendi]|uniref:EF-hand domain-containing protein n=1 Tax=Pseudomonas juntendi TaxID=2666183 RepID=UPI003B957CF6
MRTLITIGLLVVSGMAAAQPQMGGGGGRGGGGKKKENRVQPGAAHHHRKFEKVEATKGMPRVAQHFAEIDTDGKGYVTLDQLKTFMAQSQGQ